MSSEATIPRTRGLERLELRFERLHLTFRFTYAFHAREVRFECDRGEGFVRVFPETFSFRSDRHDPAEIYLQFDDLSRKPRLLSPNARRRDVEILISRLMLGVPRYLDRLLTRIEDEGRVVGVALDRVYEDIALLAQTLLRFIADKGNEEAPGVRMATFHLRKLSFHTLNALLQSRVTPEYLERYVEGSADPVDPADDLSESGFFYTLEGGDPAAVNRSLVRLAERAFYRWLEDVCLDEENAAFEVADSPFASREIEVLRALSVPGTVSVQRSRDLIPFLRRPGNRDCLRVLKRLEEWFLRQYDVHHAAVMINHGDKLGRGLLEPDRILSRHGTRNYVLALVAMTAPFAGSAVAYERAPTFFDVLCAGELIVAYAAAFWFLLYRFCWKRDLTFFHSSVPRIAAGIIVGYLPIFFLDEVWGLAERSWVLLLSVSMLLGFITLLYLYVEVQRRIGQPDEAFARARRIFLLGLVQATGIGIVLTGLMGRFMAARNWGGGEPGATIAALRDTLPPFLGELPRIVGVEPFVVFPPAVLVMPFLSFFIGTFLQLLWEEIPITDPL